ncbi:hypothetical protein DPMN_027145 [Dreissena polymorpha]|uniref:Uncharacterized protein n=1 Tax=Dreissena polymorpha TaxID=45954 RepID=A0A9D4LWG9_DREPO|nr:hypothetical protein DPMN_027145 [Dreissena polymorpha]
MHSLRVSWMRRKHFVNCPETQRRGQRLATGAGVKEKVPSLPNSAASTPTNSQSLESRLHGNTTT